MPERLADVIRNECVTDGQAALAAFANLETLGKKYPKVAAAIVEEAGTRLSMGGPTGVLEKIARPFLEQQINASATEPPRPPATPADPAPVTGPTSVPPPAGTPPTQLPPGQTEVPTQDA